MQRDDKREAQIGDSIPYKGYDRLPFPSRGLHMVAKPLSISLPRFLLRHMVNTLNDTYWNFSFLSLCQFLLFSFARQWNFTNEGITVKKTCLWDGRKLLERSAVKGKMDSI